MKTKAIFICIATFLVTACKKNYTCECFNPGGVVATYKIHDTKNKAEKKCKEYAEPYNYPFSESGCQLK